ncbi:hypothetical protein [Clostridium magnum]|uniref:Uncharacterized protein n=1 Tax=Clostridium magnum DSM 2767 TaxID=1121326 RepID=A0A161W0N7_9CLOT|nr:hypothetical protein [Clostridium magnum]KZL88680.1 hypothetical protein CLMAG_59690 [Clostridium magnum DSM 2767]SHJ60843.1 hypothetical protein SAMN02745944_06230 [Clostridium magnum DSM 2767]
MLRIIKVEEVDMYGFEGNTKYFKSLNRAKKYFKELIKSHKDDLAKEDLSYLGKPLVYSDNSTKIVKNKPGIRNKSASMECWYSSETDCGTEWDTHVITVNLEEILIEN